MTIAIVQGAHLVGSVIFPDTETTLRAAADTLGGRLKLIPDGEVGNRVMGDLSPVAGSGSYSTGNSFSGFASDSGGRDFCLSCGQFPGRV